MKNTKNEKGIALILVLGMLSLILIMALAFTATSMVEVKNSTNNANRAVARLVAKSTVNKVAGMLQFYENVYFSHTQSAPNDNDSDWVHKLDSDPILKWDNSYASDINWEYLTADDAGTNKIVARYAYAVIPGGGVDPGDLVKTGVNESTSVTVEERPGVEMNELNIGAFYESMWLRSTVVDKFNWSGTGGGTYYTGTWLSFSKLFSEVGLGDYDSHKTFKTMLQRFCIIDASNSNEAFWLDESAAGRVNEIDIDTSNDSLNELYHRFNLNRFTDSDSDGVFDFTDLNSNGVFDYGELGEPNLWDTITIDNIIGVSPAFPAAADEFNGADANYDGYCIPWIKNWSENSGGWPDAATKKKQIAANLIDYGDFDDNTRTGVNTAVLAFNERAETDGVLVFTTPPSTLPYIVTTSPTFVGNDLTAYINEAHLRFDPVPITYDAGLDRYDWGDGLLKFKVELHNMYGGTTDPDHYAASTPYLLLPDIQIDYDVEMIVKVDGVIRDSQRLTNKLNPALAAGNIVPNAYKISNITGASVTFGTLDGFVTGLGAGKTEEVEAIVHDLKIYVVRDTTIDLQDYADICDTYTIAGIESPGTYRHKFFRVNDPRHNQFATLWTPSDTGYLVSDYLGGSTNPECLPALSGDMENQGGADEAQDVSTDYIRNRQMQSPWEIGAIHRAGTWETINLKKYNTTAGALISGGGGAYVDGDANILDQIKMTSANSSLKKVPVRTQATELLHTLFRGIVVGNAYSAPGTIVASRQISSTEADNLAAAFLAGNNALRSRAELANISQLSSSTFQDYGTSNVFLDNDAKQEEIIGKIANLSENVKNDYFTVIAIAQSIKDIGGGIAINMDLNHNGAIDSSFNESGRDINGDNLTNTAGLSETIANCQFGTYEPFADQILSSQKVVAQIYRDPITGKCTVLKFEYYD